MSEPTPPEGYRLLTNEEKNLPLPMDAIYFSRSFGWTDGERRGKLANAAVIYATREPTREPAAPSDGEMLDWVFAEIDKIDAAEAIKRKLLAIGDAHVANNFGPFRAAIADAMKLSSETKPSENPNT